MRCKQLVQGQNKAPRDVSLLEVWSPDHLVWRTQVGQAIGIRVSRRVCDPPSTAQIPLQLEKAQRFRAEPFENASHREGGVYFSVQTLTVFIPVMASSRVL